MTIQIVAVQSPENRGHVHVRVFGYRVSDMARRIVEVALSPEDAADLVADCRALGNEWPAIEVPDNSWAFIINTGDMPMIHLRETP